MVISSFNSGCYIFTYEVEDPRDFGVAELDSLGKVISIEEKPENPKSNNAIVGIYVFDGTVINKIKTLKPSPRGEYEITDVNLEYLKRGKLEVRLLGRGTTWLDTGTFKSLMQASQFVQMIEDRQGRKIGCIEEDSFKMGFIDASQLEKLAQPLIKSGYGKYLISLIKK